MVERTDARGFAVDFNRTYDEKTELKRLCSHSYYEGESDAEFFQIGRRVAVPRGIVEEGRYRYVSDGVVGALCEGEKSFVVDRLADSDEVPTVETGEEDLVAEAHRFVEDADTVLVPRKEAWNDVVSGWEEKGRLRLVGDDEYLGDGEDGYWLRRHDGEAAFVVSSQKLGIVQKKDADCEPPRFSHDGHGGVNDGGDIGVYFGNSGDGYVDIAYRVVVSEPIVKDGGVCRLLL
ncbi:MAG: hypothetical protein ACOCRA_02995 [Halobacteria archaeon]